MNTIKKQDVDEKFKMILNYLVKERQRQKISQNEIANLLEIKKHTAKAHRRLSYSPGSTAADH